eukprot:m.311479 g.311479  ORF g.311479 m.311479 type:complete len:993 (-) comp15956_c0_seq1:6014-8992(-)
MSALVDYVVVSGLDPEKDLATISSDAEVEDFSLSPLQTAFQPNVLESYPSCRPWHTVFNVQDVVLLSFPRGLMFKREGDTRRICFHTFVLTRDDGTKAYGANLVFYERVQSQKLLTAVKVLETMHLAQQEYEFHPSHRSSSLVPRPSSRAGFDPETQALFAPKCLTLVSSVPAVASFEQLMRQLFMLSQHKPGVVSQNMVVECVENLLYSVPLPPPGMTVEFSCIAPIQCHIPGSEQLPLFQHSMRRLFSLFPPLKIIKLLTCALLEKQLIIRSQDYELLVLVGECITTLMYPFKWMHVYVPILPCNALHFVEAPVPFIMGIHSDLNVPSADFVPCIVDIGREVVQIPADTPEFPFTSELTSRLQKLLRSSGGSSGCETILVAGVKGLPDLLSGRKLPVRPNNPGTFDDLRFTESVRLLFLEVWAKIMNNYEKYLVRPQDPAAWLEGMLDSPVFDEVSFLCDQPDSHVPFLRSFIQTQSFGTFVDDKMSCLLKGEPIDTCFEKVQVLYKQSLSVSKQRAASLSSDGAAKNPAPPLAKRIAETLGTQELPTVDFQVTPSFPTPLDIPADVICGETMFCISPWSKDGERLIASHLQQSLESSEVKELLAHDAPKDAADTPEEQPSSKGDSLPLLSFQAIKDKLDDGQMNEWPEAVGAARDVYACAIPPVTLQPEPAATELLHEFDVKVKRFVSSALGVLCKPQGLVRSMSAPATAPTKRLSDTQHGTALGKPCENSLVASFCDLLDRVFAHRLKEAIETPTWTVVSACVQVCGAKFPELKFCVDVASSTVSSDIGRGRAWVRLCLERKCLASQIDACCSCSQRLSELYDDDAILCQPTIQSRLVKHLRPLASVPFQVFSANYLSANLVYTFEIQTAKGFNSGTSANVDITVNGEHGSMGPFRRPKGSTFGTGAVHRFDVNHTNIGRLMSVRIGHDNSGLTSTWTVDNVSITNNMTQRRCTFTWGKKVSSVEDDYHCTIAIDEAKAPSSSATEAM